MIFGETINLTQYHISDTSQNKNENQITKSWIKKKNDKYFQILKILNQN